MKACKTCGCTLDMTTRGRLGVTHTCSRGDECPDCPTNAERNAARRIKVRVSRPILDHIMGSSAGQGVWLDSAECRSQAHPDDILLCRKLFAANVRKDGSVTVAITEAEAWGLHLQASVMVEGAMDNVLPPGDPYAGEVMAEINAGRALMRKLEAEGVRA